MTYTMEQANTLLANINTEADLRALISQLDITSTGRATVLYSGMTGDNVSNSAIIQGMLANGDDIRVLDKTEAFKFLDISQNEALADALTRIFVGSNPNIVGSIANQFLYGNTDTNGNRILNGAWDNISGRFVAASEGEIRTLTPDANSQRVFAQTELTTILEDANSKVTHINGIHREDLVRLKSDLLATGPITQANIDTANKIVLDHVNNASAQQISEMKIAVDTDGKLTGVGTKDYFNKIGLPDMGTDLSTGQIGHSPAEWISTQQTSQALHNAQLANDRLNLYGQERLSLAEATGDAGKIADAAHYLNKLGIIGDVIGLTLVAHDANAAYAAGDSAGAQQILSNWVLEYAGGLAGGLAAAQLVSSALAPLYLTGPAGATIAGGLSLLAGVFGGIGGEELTHVIPELFNSATKAIQPIRRDPLVLDLDSDGLETTGISAVKPIYFDHDADGIKTATGWVKSDDAFLVLDKNANGIIDNGRELFGDASLKNNGQLATNGFNALRDLDSNGDGKINSSDAKFVSLRLWRDLNQDGISQSKELFSLDSQNIAAINVATSSRSQILSNGNQLADLGSYIKSDGSKGALGEVIGSLGDINLILDTFHSQFTDQLNTSAVNHLPDMQGSGQVRSLQEAASLSPKLAQLLSDFAAAGTRGAQQAMLNNILKAWSDTSTMVATFSGAYAGHKLTVNGLPALGSPERQAWEAKITLLEHFNGRTFQPVPVGTASAMLNFWSGNLGLFNQSYKALSGEGGNAANDETWRAAA